MGRSRVGVRASGNDGRSDDVDRFVSGRYPFQKLRVWVVESVHACSICVKCVLNKDDYTAAPLTGAFARVRHAHARRSNDARTTPSDDFDRTDTTCSLESLLTYPSVDA